MDMPAYKVRKIMKIAQEPISLETPIGEEEDSHLGDFIEDKTAVSPIDSVISNLAARRGEARPEDPDAARGRGAQERFGIATAPSTPSKRSAGSSTSPASASARSSRRRSASCATRRAAAS
jgi:hypothetical protein